MALHEIPADSQHKHLPSPDCPCRPTSGKTRGIPVRTLYRHRTSIPVPDGAQGAGEHDETSGGAQ